MKRQYYSLHVHSEYSNLKIIDSINRYARSIDYAWDLNLSGVAMTEHDCLSGSLKYIKAFKAKVEKEWLALNPEREDISYAEKCKELDFKPILGNEIYLTQDGINKDSEKPSFYHMILLAKDKEGFQQLKELSSRAWKRAWMKSILRTPTYIQDLFDIVKGGHLIATTACLGSFVGQTVLEILNGQEELRAKLDNHLCGFRDLFGYDNFFIELQPNEEGSEQNAFNKYMIENFWGKFNFIFSTDAHYAAKEELPIFSAFLNSKSSKEREVNSFYSHTYFMSQSEVRGLMNYVTDTQFEMMVANTKGIAARVELYDIGGTQVVTKVPYERYDELTEALDLFEGIDTTEYPYISQFIQSEDRADGYFVRLIAEGYLKYNLENWDTDTYFKRIDEELWTLSEVSKSLKMNMADYFISMAKMIEIIWEKGNSIVGPSRGSAGALLINYLLGITQMDPIAMNLPFVWRFLHPSRPDLPDIDIDTESDKRTKIFNEIQKYFVKNGGDVVNICTFGTEGTKSALKTAGRGLGIDETVMNYLTSLIPNERGFDWSLSDCYEGNEAEDRKPIKEFKKEIDKYPLLWSLVKNIEGLVTRLGVHAAGIVAVNGNFVERNSFMRTSKGQIVSAFDLHDSEELGLIKYDFLTVSALDRIRQTMNYLLEDGKIEWKGSLRETYNEYLAPQVLDFHSKGMWEMVSKGEISSLFQFDTAVGVQAIKEIKPDTVEELAMASSLMRLMGEGELPLDIYVRYKTALSLWYEEMNNFRLTKEEVSILERYLLEKKGVGDSQEVLMQIVMDKDISAFTMQEANLLRKTIAKKQFRAIEKVKELFFTKGKENGASENLLKYIWSQQVSRQLGYSFSTIHTTGYALIALQEMNLAYKYPTIYWNASCLSVDASAVTSEDFESLIEEEILDIDSKEDKRTQNKMDYAKLANALDKFKKKAKIILPDINLSKLGFTPNSENNTILYGLKGISRVTEPVIQEIMNNRPFTSLKDFTNKVTKRIVTKDKVINLIKSGAFNGIEGKNRSEILKDFIWTVCEPKKKLTMQNANKLIEFGLLDDIDVGITALHQMTKELRKCRDSAKMWYNISALDIPESQKTLWKNLAVESGIKGVDLVLDGIGGRWIDSAKWDQFYYTKTEKLKIYIKEHHDILLERLNNKLFEIEFEKYASGGELDWELDSMNFYFSGHPLAKTKTERKITRVEDIIEGMQDGEFFIDNKVIPRMKIYTVMGTVIDRDKTKGLVVLQTPDGVVNIKCYKQLYALYAHEEIEVDAEGNKNIKVESFFEKGVHLAVSGFQRGSSFIPKVYKNTGIKAILRLHIDRYGKITSLEAK